MDTPQDLIPPDYQPHFKNHSNLEAQARTLAQIHDDASYRAACEFRVVVDRQRKTWAMVIKPAVSSAYLAHQQIKAVENLVAEPLANSLAIIDRPIADWRIAQERQRRLEQERINRELQAREEEARLEEAEELEKSGRTLEADAVLDAPRQSPEVVLPSSTKVEGIQDRTYWSADVFDLKLLCKAVAEGKADLSLVKPNETALNGIARAMKSAMNAEWLSKGVRAVSRVGLAGNGR